MAKDRVENIRVKLKGVVINDPSVFRQKATIEDGPEKYRANFSMDPEKKADRKNIKLIEEAIEQAKEQMWPGKEPKFKEGRMCFYDGNENTNDDGDVRDGYADRMILRATNKKKPLVLDRNKEPLDESEDKIYGGAVVDAIVDIYPIKDKKFGGNGIFATLKGIRWVEEGETRFGGDSGIDEDAFDDLDDDEDDDDEDERPKKSKKADKKKSKSRDDDDDDDEDERPKKSKKKDKKKSKSRDDDDDDDEDI